MPSSNVYLVTSGDLRLSANQLCWPAQAHLEEKLSEVVGRSGKALVRAFPYNHAEKHGFISSQRMGMDVFLNIPPDAPLIFATAAWQYSHHVLAGMRSHQGPILTVANWSGEWPGLVGLLNLNGCLVKAGVPFSSLWSETFEDEFFLKGLNEWLDTGKVSHDLSHVRPLALEQVSEAVRTKGKQLADDLRRKKAILGVFDEGCMGMYNAIIDDELLNPAGIYKERLSQSALVARMRTVSDVDAQAVRSWLEARGLRFNTGTDDATQLTDSQILQQCKIYIASMRMADEFGCDAIGIQYQQGLKDMVPASDLAEGLLNNRERPPVMDESHTRELYPGEPLPHFNEVDEGAAVDALVTQRCWTALGLDPSNTLHDLRWGGPFHIDGKERFVWVLQISGAAPASHFEGGYAGASSDRQPAMYFPLGGGTLKGIGRPGEIVWSRIFVENNTLCADLGRGTVVRLPEQETQRRWSETTSQWPLVSTVLHGVDRDAMMARHRANHIQIAYAPDLTTADHALATKASMLAAMGVKVFLCGSVKIAD